MELVNYLRIVRRRWRLVLALTVVGVLIGSGSTLLRGTTPSTSVNWYIAKHTLVSSDNSANLLLAADLATQGEVPKKAAAKLGVDDPVQLAANVRVEPRTDVGLLYVAAVGTDPQRTADVADAFAEELVLYLRDFGETQKQARVATFDKEIESLNAEYLGLEQQLQGTTDSGQRKLLESRQQDLAKKINVTKDQRNTVANQVAPTQLFTTLSTAESVPVTQTAVDKLLASDPRAVAKGGASAATPRPSDIDAALSSSRGVGPLLRGLLGGLGGLLAGSLLVVVLDRVDPRIRTKAEAEEAFGWPVIGEVPPLTRRERQGQAVLAWSEPRSRAAEAYRVLRSALLFVTAGDGTSGDDEHPIFAGSTLPATGADVPGAAEPDGDTAPSGAGPTATDGPGADPGRTRGQVIMVSSPGPSEGKTTTTANLAAILAETGKSVLVINCDFRRPRVHTYLGAEDVPRKVIDTALDGVKLVSQVLENPDDANPAEVVHVQRQVIRNARKMFDVVLLDTAPLLTTNDATEVLSVTDQVIIVARTGKTHKEAADRAAELLERRNAPVVGVVLNGATDVPTARYYYYGDQPDRAEPEPGEEEVSPFDELVAEDHGDEAGADVTTADDAAADQAADAADGEGDGAEHGGTPEAVAAPTAEPLAGS